MTSGKDVRHVFDGGGLLRASWVQAQARAHRQGQQGSAGEGLIKHHNCFVVLRLEPGIRD